MLKIQEFIFAHDNWRELLSAAPYNLKISEDDGFVLFKYSQINSDFSQEICKEARGLILDSQNNFRVVRYAFKKFFNIDEGFAAHIDWNTAIASEKIDGSIMSVWFARGKWHLSTNGTIDAFKAEINGVGPYKTFGDLFESVLPLSWFAGTLSSHFAHLCYTFELVSPWNKIVIDYPETKVYLLSVRNMFTLKEYPIDEVAEFAKRFNFTMPQFYYMNDEIGFRNLVSSMSEGHEGVVVRDANNNRVKIKTALYFELHRMKNNGVLTLEKIVDLILANDQHEFLSYFPEYRPMFDDVKSQLDKINSTVQIIKVTVDFWKKAHPFENDNRTARKWFAQDFGKNKYSQLYFLAYDGRLDDLMSTIKTDKLIKLFKIELKENYNA